MALTVEDGTGLAAADAYVSEADADTYVTAYEPEGFASWNAALSAAKEVAIRKATQYLDSRYSALWKGQKVVPYTQALDWPRYRVYADGALLDYTALPVLLVNATVELAVRFVVSGDLEPDVDSSATGIKRERDKLGPLESEIEYAGTKATRDRQPKVERMLAPLLLSGNGSGGGRLSLA